MDKKLQVDRDILFFAFRYALGRSSYAPASITENIKHNIDNLSDGDLRAYIREIEECGNLGHDMDIRHWNEFKMYLGDQLKNK